VLRVMREGCISQYKHFSRTLHQISCYRTLNGRTSSHLGIAKAKCGHLHSARPKCTPTAVTAKTWPA